MTVNAEGHGRRGRLSRRPAAKAWLEVWLSGRPGTSGVLAALVTLAFLAGPPARLGSPDYWGMRARAETASLVVALAVVAVTAVIKWGLPRWRPTEAVRTVRWCSLPKFRWLLWWPLAALAATGVVLVIFHFTVIPVSHLAGNPTPGTMNNLGRPTGSSLRGFVVTVVIGAPILEELVFRGCLQSWLARRLPLPAALLIATAAFTAVHTMGAGSYNVVQLGEIAIDGLLFGVLYQLSGSLLVDTAAHMANNLVSFLAQAHPRVNPLLWPAMLLVVGAPGAVVVGWRALRALRGCWLRRREVAGAMTD